MGHGILLQTITSVIFTCFAFNERAIVLIIFISNLVRVDGFIKERKKLMT